MPSSKEEQVNQVNNTYIAASDWNPVIVLFKKTFCMGKITEMLDAVDVRKENTEELYKIFRLVPDYDIPLMRFSLDKGVSLIRQRINLRGEVFCLVSDLGYPPASYVTRYERANLPYQSMFYACSFPFEDIPEDIPLPRVVAVMETSAFFRDKKACGIERSTVSRWIISEDLDLVAMPFIADYSRACGFITAIKNEWENEIGKYNVNPDGLELIMYMAKEIGKAYNSNIEYFKIANFVNYLLNVNKKTRNADGIIYPSVPGAGAGFNVAIKSSVADKKIVFSNASLCHLLKKGEQSYLRVINRSISVENGLITYQPLDSDPQENYICAQFAGLDFVN